MIHAVNVAKCQPQPDYAPPSKKVECSPAKREQLVGFQIFLAESLRSEAAFSRAWNGRGAAFHNHLTELCSGSESGPYLRRIDSCIPQLKAQGPSRTCDQSKEKEKETSKQYRSPRARNLLFLSRSLSLSHTPRLSKTSRSVFSFLRNVVSRKACN